MDAPRLIARGHLLAARDRAAASNAIGGNSPEAHRADLDRVIQAGGQPISWVSLADEFLRDWDRPETLAIAEIVVTGCLAKEQ